MIHAPQLSVFLAQTPLDDAGLGRHQRLKPKAQGVIKKSTSESEDLENYIAYSPGHHVSR